MTLDAKYEHEHVEILKDTRPWRDRIKEKARDPSNAALFFTIAASGVYIEPVIGVFGDLIFLIMSIYFYWLTRQKVQLPFKLPKSAKVKDPNNKKPGGGIGMAEGILYLGNKTKGEEVWFNNNDARTHMLYLGTTGSGKTVGLKSISSNALCWGSGYIYIDGKADTDLWSNLSALARRFGRDDDILIMNYMTGNAGGRVPSNTLNPFSSGSASYLVNMLVSLMPDSEGDNAMWKDRAVSLISAIMPCLVWRRDNQNIPMSIAIIRTFLTFPAIIKLSRSQDIPDDLLSPIKAYLDELPGYVDDVFDDDGNEKQMGPEAGAVDTATPRQQHGYLSMQFTRSMSSLGDDYGFIFDTQAADVDMLDVVINRRILVVLIPALEKSSDETANLGKIIASTLKGMMGATLGSTVEGDTATAIENKPTNSSTPFIAIFDEVGYYAAQGMAVMAAQARSLGFCLVFAAQDMPALEKRVKEEARSITANCNIKVFGKLEDPTTTKEFFEKTVGQAIVTEASGYEKGKQSANASVQVRARASYDGLKSFTEGQAICAFGKNIAEMVIYFSDVGHAKAMRVHRFLAIPPPSAGALESLQQVDAILRKFRDPKWHPEGNSIASNADITSLAEGFSEGLKSKVGLLESGAISIANVAKDHNLINLDEMKEEKKEDINTENISEDSTVLETAPKVKESIESIIVKDDSSINTDTKKDPLESKDEESGPISWGDLMGIDAPEEESKTDKSLIATEIEPKEIDSPIKKETPDLVFKEETSVTTKESVPISWEKLIGMEEEDEPFKLPEGDEDSTIKTTEDTDFIVEKSVADSINERDSNTEETNKISKKTSNDILSWGDIIGITTDEENNNIEINSPALEENESTIDRGEEINKTVGWGDIMNLPETEDKFTDKPNIIKQVDNEESNAVNWKDIVPKQEDVQKNIETETENKKEVAKAPVSWSDLMGVTVEKKKNSGDENNDGSV